jgi:hypothetical protein
MSRPISDINNQIVSSLVSNFATIGITINPDRWSKRNMIRMMCFVFASCTAYLEQLMDVLKDYIELTSSHSAAASSLWIQAQMFRFQYDSTTPQVLQLIDTVPQYPLVNESMRIITGCSVSSNTPNEVTIKLAKNNPFDPLTSNEKDAQGYINLIGTAGINYSVVSLVSDKIYIETNIYYKGQYSSIIQANVKDAIRAYLQNLSVISFDGSVKMSDIETTIRNVTGVNDVELINVRGREDTAIFTAGIDIILSKTILSRQWHPIAGYVVEENTAGKTFTDKLTFIAE